MKKGFLSISLILIFLIPVYVLAQQSRLSKQIKDIIKPAKGIVGVSILDLESRDTLSFNGDAHLVMHSIMKFPIALTVLHWVDSGKLTLNQMIHVKKKDLPKTYSPLRDKYPNGNVDVSVSELLSYMISLSDNDACDILLKLIDGPKTVQNYMFHIGISGISVKASEAEMASSWKIQYTNWCKPFEMTLLLDKFNKGKLLAKPTTEFLYKILTETSTGRYRLKGMLPAGTIVAHKTGTSPSSADGLTPATNDVGIITLPNGKHLAISVFVGNSRDDETTRESINSQNFKGRI